MLVGTGRQQLRSSTAAGCITFHYVALPLVPQQICCTLRTPRARMQPPTSSGSRPPVFMPRAVFLAFGRAWVDGKVCVTTATSQQVQNLPKENVAAPLADVWQAAGAERPGGRGGMLRSAVTLLKSGRSKKHCPEALGGAPVSVRQRRHGAKCAAGPMSKHPLLLKTLLSGPA